MSPADDAMAASSMSAGLQSAGPEPERDRTALLPPATIGMLGGGQLGRFALIAAAQLGYRTIVLDPDPSAPAAVVAGEHIVAAYDDPAALARLAAECDVVTTEFENPPAHALEELATHTRVAPAPSAVAIAQDRIIEKGFLTDGGFPVGPWAPVTSLDALDALDDSAFTGPAVMKTARLGYDGKGQHRLADASDAEERRRAWDALGGVPCVVEALLDLHTEVSVLVARTHDGAHVTWPVAENHHVDGILDLSVIPAGIEPALASAAEQLAVGIADALSYVGVLAVEMFVVADAAGELRLLVNELAPRPHNSGHWTLDAAVTSQFEQQIRAVCGAPLGSTSMTAPAVAMVNLLGDVWDGGPPRWDRAMAAAEAKLHLYGKAEPRPGRKMGHLTVTGETAAIAAAEALELRRALRAD